MSCKSDFLSQTKFSIEAIISCDERGQLVLPKEVRKNLGIAPGDKLALLKCSSGNEGQNCLTIIKSSSLEHLVKDFLGPMMRDIVK